MKKFIIPIISFILFFLLTLALGSGTTCFFKSIYGLPCPGCGMTRAFVSLKSGHILKAFYYHPLFILPIVMNLVICFKNIRFFNKIYVSNLFWKISLILLVSFWILRMIFLYPNTPPMDFNKNALIPKLFDLLKDLGSK